MPLVLARIDDRLVHGQVVLGWGSYLKPDRIILSSDVIATESWQRDMYDAAGILVPCEMTISIWTEKETLAYFQADQFDHERAILIVESPQELLNLIEKGAPIEIVNIGGMHFKEGKRQLAPFIFVDNDDLEYLRILKRKNIKLVGQDVPTSKKINIADIIEL